MTSRLSVIALALAACAPASNDSTSPPIAVIPSWTWDSTFVFPADHSLVRPEDGVALPDGRLIVADQVVGLRIVDSTGKSAQFGDLPGAGYTHKPPANSGGANGVSLEPDGTHVLLADVFGAAIYRVEIATGATERIYQHQYGINSAVRDSKGSIWFTQSAHNTPAEGEARMWASVEVPRAEGALYHLPFKDGKAGKATLLADSMLFANGIALDESAGNLYVAETSGGRVLRYKVNLDSGTVSQRMVFVDSVGPDNLELDGAGNLWIAEPLFNRLSMVNTATGARQIVLQAQTPEQAAVVAEFMRRGVTGEPRMGLFTPGIWAPFPGLMTGIIVSSSGPVYGTTLGNALVKLPR